MSGARTAVVKPRVHAMPFGAELTSGGSVRFRLWAPAHNQILLWIDGASRLFPMAATADGWHEVVSCSAHPGSRYCFVLPDGLRIPDPASRFQPEDVHGPSEVIDPAAYGWSDHDWTGMRWASAVIYELHVGAFTREGTFRAAIDKLDHLVETGVTAMEIMPVADFPGRRNWGYDGVLPYAPDSSYGRPEDFKALVDAAHARGLMVLLDVVYNHFGPDGNYVAKLAPQFFTDRRKTPWGAAINYDGHGSAFVREFFIHNALYWIEEFHLDGLRLDAVHAMIDGSPRHVLKELAERVRAAAGDRYVHLLVENEKNQAALLERNEAGEPRWFTAQWNDDVHHVLHVAGTGEDRGYYREYVRDPDKLGRALAEGFAFQGQEMQYQGERRGEPSSHLKPDAFIAFIQNHDQVGNRAFGDRIGGIAETAAVRAIAAVYLLLPQIPMLFMGEEWNASQPFLFFCDFDGDLAEAVRKGRREEFARFPEFESPETREKIPDPSAGETFESSKLAWGDLRLPQHASWLDWYRRILQVRRESLIPALDRIQGSGGKYEALGDGVVRVRWRIDSQTELALVANLSAKPADGLPVSAGMLLWEEGAMESDTRFGPWTVRWSIEKLA